MSPRPPRIIVSIVSHGHGAMVADLLSDLAGFAAPGLSVVLTLNVPENLPALPAGLPVSIIRNDAPKGFGANHNAAFRVVSGDYFCVLNPDVRLPANPFPALALLLDAPRAGVAAPLATNAQGQLEDSARRFPTLGRLALKFFNMLAGRRPSSDYEAQGRLIEPDWTSGLFMLFKTAGYEAVSGFDERYFLYYEDVDLCARLRLAGFRVLVDPAVRVVHEARRNSHRDFRHALWHAKSIVRFFTSSEYRCLRAASFL